MLTIGGAVAFFRELEQGEILTKSTFYEESKHPLSTGHPPDIHLTSTGLFYVQFIMYNAQPNLNKRNVFGDTMGRNFVEVG